MASQRNVLLPPCRRRRADVARGRLVAIGLALGAIVTAIALNAQPTQTPAPPASISAPFNAAGIYAVTAPPNLDLPSRQIWTRR